MVSLIKGALTAANPKYQENIYRTEPHPIMRNFASAVYLDGYSKTTTDFEINNCVYLTITSTNMEFILYLYNGLMKKKEYEYRGYQLYVQDVQIQPTAVIKRGKAAFKTLSPIVLRKRNSNRYLDFEEAEYQETLNYMANLILLNTIHRSLKEPITLIPLNMQKRIVPLKHEQHFKGLKDQTLYVSGYIGDFVLEGNPEDLTILAANGLGHRRNEMFGAIRELY